MSDKAQTYSYDPTTGKRLVSHGHFINPLEPMTQKQVDYQHRLVSNCSEISEEEELDEFVPCSGESAHYKFWAVVDNEFPKLSVWSKRFEMLRAGCNESVEPFNQRIEVVRQMCIDLALQAEIDFDAKTTGCTLQQLVEHYGKAAGVAIHSMIYTPVED